MKVRRGKRRPSSNPGARHSAAIALVNGYGNGSRWNAVGHNLKRAHSEADGGWNIELCTNEFASGSHAHGAEVVRAGIYHFACRRVRNPHQGPVGGALVVIAVIGALRQAVELSARDQVVAGAMSKGAGHGSDGRLPRWLVGSAGRVDLNAR